MNSYFLETYSCLFPDVHHPSLGLAIPSQALRVGMGSSLGTLLSKLSPDSEPVPAFVRCDGHYVPSPPMPQAGGLSPVYGFVRLDGHGTVTLKMSDEHIESAHGLWEVVDEVSVRIHINNRPNLLTPLLMVAGERVDTVTLAAELHDEIQQGMNIPCKYHFLPEDHDHDHH